MNRFLSIFTKNIKSKYTCYDRVIIRGYILWMFSAANLIVFLRERGLKKHSDGVMRMFTDHLNAHMEKEGARYGIPIIWWPSVVKAGKENGAKKGKKGTNGDKLSYVEKNYAGNRKGTEGGCY